jgi:hypothetical protein
MSQALASALVVTGMVDPSVLAIPPSGETSTASLIGPKLLLLSIAEGPG